MCMPVDLDRIVLNVIGVLGDIYQQSGNGQGKKQMYRDDDRLQKRRDKHTAVPSLQQQQKNDRDGRNPDLLECKTLIKYKDTKNKNLPSL